MSLNELIEESGVIRLSDAIWTEAHRRAEIIAPLAEHRNVSTKMANEAA